LVIEDAYTAKSQKPAKSQTLKRKNLGGLSGVTAKNAKKYFAILRSAV